MALSAAITNKASGATSVCCWKPPPPKRNKLFVRIAAVLLDLEREKLSFRRGSCRRSTSSFCRRSRALLFSPVAVALVLPMLKRREEEEENAFNFGKKRDLDDEDDEGTKRRVFTLLLLLL